MTTITIELSSRVGPVGLYICDGCIFLSSHRNQGLCSYWCGFGGKHQHIEDRQDLGSCRCPAWCPAYTGPKPDEESPKETKKESL